MKLIGLAGRAGAGKDMVADHLVERHGYRQISFAAPIKRALVEMVPEITADHFRRRDLKEATLKSIPSTPRHMAQTLGTEWGRGDICKDLWIRIAMSEVERVVRLGFRGVVISDVRFPDEVKAIRQRGGIVYKVIRPGSDDGTDGGHESEQDLDDVDSVILNDGTLEDLAFRLAAAHEAFALERFEKTYRGFVIEECIAPDLIKEGDRYQARFEDEDNPFIFGGSETLVRSAIDTWIGRHGVAV